MWTVPAGSCRSGWYSAPGVPWTQCGGQAPPYATKWVVRAGCQSRSATTRRPAAANSSAARFRTGTTASPFATGSAPPGQKSFWTSTISKALSGSGCSVIVPHRNMKPTIPHVRGRGLSSLVRGAVGVRRRDGLAVGDALVAALALALLRGAAGAGVADEGGGSRLADRLGRLLGSRQGRRRQVNDATGGPADLAVDARHDLLDLLAQQLFLLQERLDDGVDLG